MPFVLGFALVQLCAWVFGTFAEAQGYTLSGTNVTGRDFFLPVVALPTVASWVATELALALRRPRLFVAPWSTALARSCVLALIGAAIGLLTLGAEGLALTIAAERVRDWWIMGLCPFTTCAVFVAILPRYTPQTGCTRCGYDWHGLSKCPECAAPNPAYRSILPNAASPTPQ